MAEKKRIKSPYCTNCGKVLREEDNYCPHCSQENDNKRQSFGRVMSDLILGFLSVDSRVAHSLPALIFRPGFLTKEFMKGRRQRYLDPVRMFISIVVIYFLLSSTGISTIMNRGGSTIQDSATTALEPGLDTTIQVGDLPVKIKTGDPDKPVVWYDSTGATNNNVSVDLPKFKEVKAMVQRGKTDTREILDSLQIENTFWNRFLYTEAVKLIRADFDGFADYMISKLPWIIFCIIPVFALLLKLLYIRRKFLYIDHLIFAFHLHSFIFMMLLLSNLFERWSFETLVKWPGFGVLIYTPFAFKNFYAQGWLKTLTKLTLLLFMYSVAAVFFALIALVVVFLLY